MDVFDLIGDARQKREIIRDLRAQIFEHGGGAHAVICRGF